MISLQDFKNSNLKINWKVVDIGCLGSKMFKRELDYEDIINFSLEKFEEDEQNKIILKIISSNKSEYNEIGRLVTELANNENSKYDIACRKWKLIYIKKNLPKANKDYIQGLIDLGNLWVRLNFPMDSPHIFQGINNNISPDSYYTEKNYIYLYARHLEWIKNETNELKKL